MEKPLLVVQDATLERLQSGEPETGMGYQIVKGPAGLYAVFSDGAALPFHSDATYYDLDNLLAGVPVPHQRGVGSVALEHSFRSRASASAAMLALAISPLYAGGAGALPLIGSVSLPTNTTFYRYLQSTTDHRYTAGTLAAGTYLTTQLELTHANTGFAAVGRFALPLPLPACNVVHYKLLAGAIVNVGTVAPLFGQAGGGVEVQLPAQQAATNVGSNRVPAF